MTGYTELKKMELYISTTLQLESCFPQGYGLTTVKPLYRYTRIEQISKWTEDGRSPVSHYRNADVQINKGLRLVTTWLPKISNGDISMT